MQLDTVDAFLAAFYRLVGTTEDDESLIEHGESENDVAFECLTAGCWEAQRYLLDQGFGGWRKRSTALSWSGADLTDGGRYSDLPTDFLRAYGDNQGMSALTEANGRRWGVQITDEDGARKRGNAYFIRGEQVWLVPGASPPTTLYLDYHYRHAVWNDSLADGNIDFPMMARRLVVVEAAYIALDDSWLPGGPDLELKIVRARDNERRRAREVARQTKAPRSFKKAFRVGNHW